MYVITDDLSPIQLDFSHKDLFCVTEHPLLKHIGVGQPHDTTKKVDHVPPYSALNSLLYTFLRILELWGLFSINQLSFILFLHLVGFWSYIA